MIVEIGITSLEDMRARTIAIAQGKQNRGTSDPKIWATSLESVARVLSAENQKLLREIKESKPASLKELAEKTGRHTSNLSRTLKTMESYNLVKLERENGRLRPTTEVTGIRMEVAV